MRKYWVVLTSAAVLAALYLSLDNTPTVTLDAFIDSQSQEYRDVWNDPQAKPHRQYLDALPSTKSRFRSLSQSQEHHSPNPPNPGVDDDSVTLSQINTTFFDPTRDASNAKNLLLQGLSTGVPPQRNGVGRQWRVDGLFIGDPSKLHTNGHGHVNHPKATWLWHSTGSQGPIATSYFTNRKFKIGYENLEPFANRKYPVCIWGNGFGFSDADVWRTLVHHATRGCAVFAPTITLGDNPIEVTADNPLNFPNAITDRALDDTFLLDWLHEINAYGSGHILSGRLDLDPEHLIVLDWSDGANGHVSMMMQSGNPEYNVPADARMQSALWLPRDPPMWEDKAARMKTLNIRAFVFASTALYGTMRTQALHHDNQCPIAYLTRLHKTIHKSFAHDANRVAALSRDTHDDVNGYGVCNSATGDVVCLPAGATSLDEVFAFTTFADDVAIEALVYRDPLWQSLLFLPASYIWVNPHGFIIHDKGGNKRYNGSQTSAALELEYDSSGNLDRELRFAYYTISSSSSYYVPDHVYISEDTDFNYWHPLPVPLHNITSVWLPFPPGAPVTCP